MYVCPLLHVRNVRVIIDKIMKKRMSNEKRTQYNIVRWTLYVIRPPGTV